MKGKEIEARLRKKTKTMGGLALKFISSSLSGSFMKRKSAFHSMVRSGFTFHLNASIHKF
jgi:hypothetical protein